MRIAGKILIAALTLYLAAMALLYTLQRRVLYIPPPSYFTPQDTGLQGVTEIIEGGALIGWWSPPAAETAPVIIMFHGNGSAVYSGSDIVQTFQAQGYGVFVVAYPGYPGRDGKPSQDSLVNAAVQARSYVQAQGVSPPRIIYYGTSLGAGIASQLAATRPPALLILEAPFESARARAQNMFPMFPSGALVKDQFRSDIALSNIDAPLLWLHGTADRVIPIDEGRALYNGYDGPKEKAVFTGGGHNNIWYIGGRDVILQAIEARFPA